MNIKQIEEALEEGESLKSIAQAYSEIANLKIKRIRTEAERNRIFFEEIAGVYGLIKKFASLKKITVLKPKKTVSIVITSNHRFYGRINSDLLNFFNLTCQKIQTDKIYLGKAAIDFFKAAPTNFRSFPVILSAAKRHHAPPQSGKSPWGEVASTLGVDLSQMRANSNELRDSSSNSKVIQTFSPQNDKNGELKSFKEVLLKEDQPSPEELQFLTKELSEYNQILVFYSSMKSLLVQQPTVTDITASPANAHLEGVKAHLPGEQNFKFIFEPELPKVLQFFDSQIITLLLEGTFLESELSRTASRFISMDSAETEANKLIKQYQTLKAYAKRNMDNNTILENFATMMAVRREV